MTYKNNLREIRKEIGMPISELARRTETSRQTITNIELHGQEPSVTLALKIAKELRSDPYDIFFTNDVIQGLQNENKIA
ncbi:helix-turn-helix transcriptional regulator [Lysinibacillus antri]|uniref:Helix-turn-helix domain-containing protein n=1 Tax=Lysinibacillus antri TaxID=2498145 RepID=A0A432LFP9_9BACI|nr:helix-turn-helix domain-containing protein [Lysinibacillus antri]RUL56496.1 helix-turn-helix domain-containing protein [Lysinibacillus antri]